MPDDIKWTAERLRQRGPDDTPRYAITLQNLTHDESGEVLVVLNRLQRARETIT